MEKQENPVRIIAYYLPQYYPIPENDLWWGKGFTEWTNVGKAKPLFRGHYQPIVPADLGYYDLRLPEIRIQQAQLAKQYGIEGFCYWHYWFCNGKRLLDRVFNEVLESGQPDFPFCLGWANHDWADKTRNQILQKQLYPGDEDYVQHFQAVLPAFQDRRYIRINGNPIFHIFAPNAIPDLQHFTEVWQELASKHGFQIHFVANSTYLEKDTLLKSGMQAVAILRLYDVFKKDFGLFERIYTKLQRLVFHKGRVIDYGRASRFFIGQEEAELNCYPILIPNWDHTPRTGKSGHVLNNSTPQKFQKHAEAAMKQIKHKPQEERIIFLKSWNEWGEGNYMEPDLKFGHGYLIALQEAIKAVF